MRDDDTAATRPRSTERQSIVDGAGGGSPSAPSGEERRTINGVAVLGVYRHMDPSDADFFACETHGECDFLFAGEKLMVRRWKLNTR